MDRVWEGDGGWEGDRVWKGVGWEERDKGYGREWGARDKRVMEG